MPDDVKADFPTTEQSGSLALTALRSSRKVRLAFGALSLLLIACGIGSYLYLFQINSALDHIIEVDVPLEVAALEMEINLGETANAVQSYVQDPDPKYIEGMNASQEDFWRYANTLGRLAHTPELLRQNLEIVKLFSALNSLGEKTVALVDQRSKAIQQFKRIAEGTHRSFVRSLRGTIPPRDSSRDKKLLVAAELDLRFNDAITAIGAYVAAPSSTAQQDFLFATNELKTQIALYRAYGMSVDEELLLDKLEEHVVVMGRSGGEVVKYTEDLGASVREYAHAYREIEALLDDKTQPYIETEKSIAAIQSKISANRAVLLLSLLGALVLLVGGGSAWALSRANVEWRTSELKHELAERKKTEATLREAREAAEAGNRAKSVFLATMSHEIRTPLNGIIGMIDLIEHTELNKDQAQMIRTVNTSAYALLNIIGDILDFSKIEAGELSIERVDMSIADVFDSVVETLFQVAADKNIELVVFVSPELPRRVKGDPVRIRQILFNIIGNAIKFSVKDDGGKRAVEIRIDPCATKVDGKSGVRFTVTDHGVGIAEHNIPRLFSPFYQAEASTTRRFGGTGLGLSISKDLVDAMEGRIGVKSRVGVGTTFLIELPFDVVEGAAAFEDECDLTDVRALVAMPVSLSREAVEAYLRHCGAEVDFANDIAQVRQQLSIAGRGKQNYDVAIMCHSAPEAIEAEKGAIAALRDDAVCADTGLVILHTDRSSRDLLDLRNTEHVLIRPLKRTSLLRAVAAVTRRSENLAGALEGDQKRSVMRSAGSRRSGRILLAEDNAINQLVINRQLEHLGYELETASDGKEALQRLEQTRFSLLLTDCHMPNMDGFELTKAIRQRERESGTRLPIVAITAFAVQGDAARCFAAGMDDFLAKPVELGRMRHTLEKWLDKADAQESESDPPPVAEAPREGSGEIDMVQDAADAEPKTPVDLPMLARLLGTDDEEALERIIAFFWETMAATPAELRKSFRARDAKALRDTAHAAKGASASVGAITASSLLKKLQFAAADADWNQVEELMPEIDAAFDALKQFVAALNTETIKQAIQNNGLYVQSVT
jgi:signal transduction histidine kinase/DNA-binding response OmpR family regulator/HPt (histidine-containing phosphotransfer) domain-containing protein